MLERSKTFVSTHKSHIATAVIAAAVGGAAVFVYYHKKTILHVPTKLVEKMAAAPEEVWVSYDVGGTVLAMTAVNRTAV